LTINLIGCKKLFNQSKWIDLLASVLARATLFQEDFPDLGGISAGSFTTTITVKELDAVSKALKYRNLTPNPAHFRLSILTLYYKEL
jgi:hypothetical protein